MAFFGACGAVDAAVAAVGVASEFDAGTGIVVDAPDVRLVWLPVRDDELSDGRLKSNHSEKY